MKAKAEMERAKKLEATEIGQYLAKLEVQADMVIKSLQNVQKMVYLPQGTNLGNWPLQAFGLNALQSMANTDNDRKGDSMTLEPVVLPVGAVRQ